MTKNPRDHREWTLEEVEEDSAGYLAAQAIYHEDREKAAEQRAYEDDLERFTEAFVAAGGEQRGGAPALVWCPHASGYQSASPPGKSGRKEAVTDAVLSVAGRV